MNTNEDAQHSLNIYQGMVPHSCLIAGTCCLIAEGLTEKSDRSENADIPSQVGEILTH